MNRTNTVWLIASLMLTSCASNYVTMFEEKYQSKDYAGALAVGNVILDDEGILRSVRTRLDGDARRNKEDLLRKMQHCKEELSRQKPR